jgi:hypothetical protein
MKSITLWEAKGSEPPKRWAEKLGAQSDERFTITIQPEKDRRAAAQDLNRLMEAIGREAWNAGLTPEVLGDILGTDVKPLHLSTEPVESLW